MTQTTALQLVSYETRGISRRPLANPCRLTRLQCESFVLVVEEWRLKITVIVHRGPDAKTKLQIRYLYKELEHTFTWWATHTFYTLPRKISENELKNTG